MELPVPPTLSNSSHFVANMGKEAVVVIIDVNQSMNQPFESSEPHKTRLDCAKEVAIDIISDLMMQSKTNEVTVLALHTRETKNFLCADEDFDEDGLDEDNEDNERTERPFRNIVDFSGNGEVMGIRQPLPDLLRKIHKLQVPAAGKSKIRGGDIVSGICYATDALYQATATKKYQRRIILLTDAEHKIAPDIRLTAALDRLRAMETRLEVVGMNFESSGDFDTAASAPKIKTEPAENVGKSHDVNSGEEEDGSETNEGEETDASEEDEEDMIVDIKRPNEKFLVSLAHKTGGFVFAAHELHAMLDKILGRRVVIPSKRKLIFEIAPDSVLEEARYYLLLSKTSATRLKKKLVMMDGNNQPRTNTLGEEMYQDLENIYQHIDPETGEDVDEDQISKAYKFGSDLIPFNAIDEAGLEIRSPVKLSIVGYAQLDQVPEYLRIGPPYVLTGNESRRCCAAISALARALQRTNKVAIATFVKTKDHAPILCGLFPLEEGDEPLRLVIMRLPFAGDVKGFLQLPSLDSVVAKEDAKAATACDNLIDKLMLPDVYLESSSVPNPKIRSFYKTVIGRVLDKESPVVDFRGTATTGTGSHKTKIMETPQNINERAQPSVDAFYNSFSLKKEHNSS
jgi:ATP-dependent DNA helicase 2 subunit 2